MVVRSQYDLIVIGCGLVGVCTAIAAAEKSPGLHIAMLDADTAGMATIGRSSAMLLPFAQSNRIQQMAKRSREFYQQHSGFSADIWCNYPFYWIDEAVEGTLSGHFNALTSASRSDLAELNQRFPDLVVKSTETAFLDQDVFRANPRLLHKRLVEVALSKPNISLFEGVPAQNIEPTGDSRVAIDTPFRKFTSGHVAICVAGALGMDWISQHLPDQSSRTKKIVSFYLPWPAGDAVNFGIGFVKDETFLMPEADRNRLILSVTSHEWDVDIFRKREEFTQAELNLANQYLTDRFSLPDDAILGASVFADSYSPDREPHVIAPEIFDGRVTVATGTSGYGVKIAPALADQMMENVEG